MGFKSLALGPVSPYELKKCNLSRSRLKKRRRKEDSVFKTELILGPFIHVHDSNRICSLIFGFAFHSSKEIRRKKKFSPILV